MGAKTNLDSISVNYFSFNPRTRDGCELENQQASKARKRFNPRTRDGCEAMVY